MTECVNVYMCMCVYKCACVMAHVQMLWSTCGRTEILNQSFLIFQELQYALFRVSMELTVPSFIVLHPDQAIGDQVYIHEI